MTTQKGVLTPWQLWESGRKFVVAEESPEPPCYQDHWGTWVCGHDHSQEVELQDAYEFAPGWTAQG